MNPSPISEAKAKSDFADWLSPILVKELRQGLRTKVFTITFLVAQLLLITCVLIGLLVAANGGNTSVSTGFFWALVALPLLLILPLSGLNAISAEIRNHTLDLVFLTRLSAWRILTGKWIAIVAQSVLLLAAVLPYIVLRYFMGGVDLTLELIASGLMLVVSAVISATLVGLSAYPGRLIRICVHVLLGILAVQGTFIIIMMMFSPLFGGGRGGFAGIGTMEIIVISVLGILLAILMLEFGAARIAPLAENHALRKRMIGVGVLLVAVLARLIHYNTEFISSMAFGIMLPILIGALCEESALAPSLYRPFAKYGWVGRLFGKFFYPGWPSGLLYVVTLLGGFAGLCHAYQAFEQWRFSAAFLALCGALFLPVALTRLIFSATRRALMIFIIFQIAAVLLALAVRIVDDVTKTKIVEWLCFIPTCCLVALMTRGVHELSSNIIILVEGGVLLASIITLFILSKKTWQKISALERESLTKTVSHDRMA